MSVPATYLLYCPADSAVAHRLQNGLQRFSRSFWQKDGIDVRVDPASAKNDTEPKVVLVVSTASAASPQFNRDVEAWIEGSGTDGLLLVVLADEADEFTWGDPSSVSYQFVPDSLRTALVDEPRHLQIPTNRTAHELTLRDEAFRDQVAQLVASVRGVPKDQVDGEDLRQQRRRNRLAFSALGVVLALLVGAGVLAVMARNQQQAADEQEIRAQEATEEAQTQTRLTAAAELAANVLSNTPELLTDPRLLEGSTEFDPEYHAQFMAEQELLGLLAVAAYQLDPSAQTRAAVASRSVVWRRYEPAEVASGQYGFPLLDDQARVVYPANGASNMLLASGAGSPVERVELSGIDRIITVGGRGRWLLGARDVPGESQTIFDYSNAADLPPSNVRDWSSASEWQEIDPGAGPQDCSVAPEAECQEAVLLDLHTGVVQTTLRTELGIRSSRPSPGDPTWPDPVRQHRFTTDGAFLLSHDAVADQLVITNTTSGASQTIWSEGDGQLADFGVIDDQTGWRLHGTTLETVALTDGETMDQYDLSPFGEPLSIDFFPEGDQVIVGFAPADYRIIDLASMTTLVTAAVGDLAEEIDIGPNGEWVATSGADFLYLLDGETLTEMTRTSVLAARVDLGIDESEVSFDPDGRRVMMRLMNPAGFSVSVAELDPDRWQQEICIDIGRSLSAEEWEEYVGLADREEVCSVASIEAALAESEQDAPPVESEDDAAPTDDQATDSTSSSEDTTTDTTAQEASPPDEATVEGPPANSESAWPSVTLVGSADGLADISFGESEVVTVRALQDQLGEPTDRFACNDLAGCGPHDPLGVFVSWGGLTVHIADASNTFSYYSVSDWSGEATPAVETERGVRLGTPAAELLAGYPNLEQFSGCADYDAVYEPASGAPVDGEFIDRERRYMFTVSDGVVASIQGSTEAAFWFWSALWCLP